jgi:SAM-dependent methyltransferase
MKRRLMDFLICRSCKTDYELVVDDEQPDGEIVSGTIRCPQCGARYPILRGIPRFLPDLETEADLRKVYADSFGHQWTTYDWLRDEDEQEFFAITDLTREDIAGLTVLDAGCGGGRLARIVAPLSGEYVGFDYSVGVDKAYELCRPYANAHFVQCDVNRHPFKPGLFDFVYSHGVIHHTPNTYRSFRNLPPLVKPDGLLYIAVFRKTVLPLRASDQAWRSVFNRLPIATMDKVCDVMSHLKHVPAAPFWKRFFWFSLQNTHEIRKCCLYDWYGPRYHHEHTVDEVMNWFITHGFGNPRYINAWPYCPPREKYVIPSFKDGFRIGQLLGVIGRKTGQRVRSVERVAVARPA